MKIAVTTSLLIGLLLLAGCSTTRLITSWKDDSYKSGQLKKPMIMAITEKRIVRSRLEDEIVQKLREEGVTAVQSYKAFPELNGLTVDMIKANLAESGLDSILVTRMIDTRQETGYVPGTTSYYANHGSFGNYYSSSMAVVSTPGYSYDFKVYTLESNLYAARDEKLIWTGLSEADEANTVDTSLKDLAVTVADELKKKKIF